MYGLLKTQSKALEVFRANLNVSVGSDRHSSQVTKIHIERLDPAFGGTFEGSDSSALAGPGGFYKMISSQGREWVGTMAWGGSYSMSYAHAGSDGMIASAGSGGHAVAMSDSGSKFGARIMEPGGQILTKH